jgi:hypothetical protein
VSPARESCACVLWRKSSPPRRSLLTAELHRALRRPTPWPVSISPVPVVATATITEAGAYRFRRVIRSTCASRVGDDRYLFPARARSSARPPDLLHRKTLVGVRVRPALHLARCCGAARERLPLGGYSRQRYFQSVHEVWARSYAQTVLRDPTIACRRRSARA